MQRLHRFPRVFRYPIIVFSRPLHRFQSVVRHLPQMRAGEFVEPSGDAVTRTSDRTTRTARIDSLRQPAEATQPACSRLALETFGPALVEKIVAQTAPHQGSARRVWKASGRERG